MPIHDPGNERPIEELFAYVSVDDRGNEGICGAPMGLGGATIPMVFGYERIAMTLMPVAKTLAQKTGKTIRLVKFTARKIVATTEPTHAK